MWEDSKDTVALSLINPKNKFRFCCLTFQNSLSVSFRSIKFNYVEETHDLGSFLALAKIVASSQRKIWRKNYFVMQDFMAKFQRANEAPYPVFFWSSPQPYGQPFRVQFLLTWRPESKRNICHWFCYKSVNWSLEELKNIKIILFLIHELLR